MIRHLQTLTWICVFALTSTAIASTQDKEKEKAPTPAAKAAPNPTPLKVQVVIGRYQGDKKISSMPYLLTMSVGNHANLRMGTRIPVMMISGMQDVKTPDGKPITPVGPVQYQDVGTNIDCSATPLDDGRFNLLISFEDTSVYPDEPAQSGAAKGNPSFRSFRASNSMILRNGETGQFTTATDKVTGETMKVDVTLTVMK